MGFSVFIPFAISKTKTSLNARLSTCLFILMFCRYVAIRQLDIFATQIRYNLFHKFRYDINSFLSSRSDISSCKAYRVQRTYRKFRRNLYRCRVFSGTLCKVCAYFTSRLRDRKIRCRMRELNRSKASPCKGDPKACEGTSRGEVRT